MELFELRTKILFELMSGHRFFVSLCGECGCFIKKLYTRSRWKGLVSC